MSPEHRKTGVLLHVWWYWLPEQSGLASVFGHVLISLEFV